MIQLWQTLVMNQILSPADVLTRLSQHQYQQQSSYLLMYSSWLGGCVKDPALMLIPVDDHQVHRGDGVFEAIKCLGGKIYLLEAHLKRLEFSAGALGISLQDLGGIAGIQEKIQETLRLSGVSEALIRIFVSRGPGGFTTNPYDSVGAQLYIVITRWTPVPEAKYEAGVRVGISHVPPKESWLATVKSCNYLPNVMMKKEAVDRNLDFTVSFDHEGMLTESSTENMIVFTKKRELLRPRGHQILKGTTMTRALELADKLKSEGLVYSIGEKDLSVQDLQSAQELMMVGTTLDILPVGDFAGTSYQDSQFVVAKKLRAMLVDDIKNGPLAVPI